MSCLSDSELDTLIKQYPLTKDTPYTITNPEKLRKELKNVRLEKTAYDFQERRLEVSRIAAPVFEHNGKFTSVVAVAGPYYRINNENKNKLRTLVRLTAKKVSSQLGFNNY